MIGDFAGCRQVQGAQERLEVGAFEFVDRLEKRVGRALARLGFENLLHEGVGAGVRLLQILDQVAKRLFGKRLKRFGGFRHRLGGVRLEVGAEGVAEVAEHADGANGGGPYCPTPPPPNGSAQTPPV